MKPYHTSKYEITMEKDEMDVEIVDRTFTIVRRVMKRRKEWSHILCPRCLQENETCIHVLQCLAKVPRTNWEKIIEDLEDTLVNIRTHPNIIAV